jgi:hypothetical protein
MTIKASATVPLLGNVKGPGVAADVLAYLVPAAA